MFHLSEETSTTSPAANHMSSETCPFSHLDMSAKTAAEARP
ncbi:hypothetical protein [Nannocystis bainbridge]|uniref:Uncharacterized protein n=1 Tax=Nannocystis bainbridge TaxID=2995303 RepID=A0ABT5DPG4_9BACT|nr:hypothetical protein [Nannocystis bainbridge]MDC0715545.1 hypothetical protein [Nannocystis bainbridge]